MNFKTQKAFLSVYDRSHGDIHFVEAAIPSLHCLSPCLYFSPRADKGRPVEVLPPRLVRSACRLIWGLFCVPRGTKRCGGEKDIVLPWMEQRREGRATAGGAVHLGSGFTTAHPALGGSVYVAQQA